MHPIPSIADILHYAADCALWDGTNSEYRTKSKFSCDAVDDALIASPVAIDWNKFRSIALFLKELGVDAGSITAFDEFPEGELRQAARYNWLKFAALIAEEEGV